MVKGAPGAREAAEHRVSAYKEYAPALAGRAEPGGKGAPVAAVPEETAARRSA